MSKALLTASAIFLIVLGLSLNFLPGEAVAAVGVQTADVLPLQLLSGALLGVGLLNWFSRHGTFGGIYGRPLGLANIMLFVVGALALGRSVFAGGSPGLWAIFAFYAVFAIAFVWVVFVGVRTLQTGK
tara:strand:- start:245 stop:628 length:384 start_codon:yes stop_codon:yes gene_type:complete